VKRQGVLEQLNSIKRNEVVVVEVVDGNLGNSASFKMSKVVNPGANQQ